ncbi:hypothetical protein PSHT_11976 [Puccinia striiformis]|uniref:Uncharacterized protein n=1 Tax=Puccinia striiformis TaxID=27350 RepID=A0A2S4UZR2_9BASI|nr:hypothetical protein PSHT_11976 [Puccinia striiformis]
MEDSRRSTQFFEDDAWKMDLIDVESVLGRIAQQPPNDGEVFNQHMALDGEQTRIQNGKLGIPIEQTCLIQPRFRQVFSWPRKRKNTARRPTWLNELPGGGLNSLEFIQILTESTVRHS